MAHSRTQWAHSRTQCRSSRDGSGSDTYVAVLLCSRCDRRSSPTVRSQPRSGTWDATPTSPDLRADRVRARGTSRARWTGTPRAHSGRPAHVGTGDACLEPVDIDKDAFARNPHCRTDAHGARRPVRRNHWWQAGACGGHRHLGAGFWGGVRTMVRMSQDRHLWDSNPRGETPSA